MAVSDGAILRIVAEFLMPELVIAQNIYYAVFRDTGGSNDEQDVVDDVTDWIDNIYTNLIAICSDDLALQITTVYVRDLVGGDWDELGTGIPTVTFTDPDTIVPHGVAALCHAYTTDPDVRGSKYFPGFADSEVTASFVSGGGLTALLAVCADWVLEYVGSATGGDFEPGVWSPTNGAFYQFIDSFVANGVVAYQRRRKPGVGI